MLSIYLAEPCPLHLQERYLSYFASQISGFRWPFYCIRSLLLSTRQLHLAKLKSRKRAIEGVIKGFDGLRWHVNDGALSYPNDHPTRYFERLLSLPGQIPIGVLDRPAARFQKDLNDAWPDSLGPSRFTRFLAISKRMELAVPNQSAKSPVSGSRFTRLHLSQRHYLCHASQFLGWRFERFLQMLIGKRQSGVSTASYLSWCWQWPKISQSSSSFELI